MIILHLHQSLGKPIACAMLWKQTIQVHLSVARYGFTMCSAHLHIRHCNTPRCDTQKCKHMRQRRTISIKICCDNDRALHIHVFILHDRLIGVWLCCLIELIASYFGDSFVMLMQKQCVELQSKYILLLTRCQICMVVSSDDH